MQIITLLPVSKFYVKFTCIKRMHLTYFSEILLVDKNLNMVNIRTESPIDTNFSVQIVDNLNFDGSEENYLDVLIYINGSKVYPGKSSFIFQSKNVAVNNVNDLRLIFNRSYISTKRVYFKVSLCGLTAFEE